MLISATCGKCQKRYKVDSKLGGRSLKCKACGGIVAVPQAEAPAGAGEMDFADGLAAAAAAEQKAVARPAAPMPTPATPRPSPTRRSPAPPNRKSPAAGQDSPPRPTGQPPVSRYLQASDPSEAEFDALGFRVNNPYPQVALNLLDTWVPKLAVYLILIVVLFPLGLAWYGALKTPSELVNYARLTGFTVGYCIFIGLAMLINLSITASGVELGAKIMKCRLPEQAWSRLMATYLFPSILALGFLMVVGSGLHSLTSGSPNMGSTAPLMSLAASLGVFLVASFFTFMFFFRLKIQSAIVCYIFFAMFYFLSCIATAIVFFLINLVLAKMLSAGSGPGF